MTLFASFVYEKYKKALVAQITSISSSLKQKKTTQNWLQEYFKSRINFSFKKTPLVCTLSSAQMQWSLPFNEIENGIWFNHRKEEFERCNFVLVLAWFSPQVVTELRIIKSILVPQSGALKTLVDLWVQVKTGWFVDFRSAGDTVSYQFPDLTILQKHSTFCAFHTLSHHQWRHTWWHPATL